MHRSDNLVDRLGTLRTPCYLLDETEFRSKLQHAKSICNAQITFSIKANPFLAPIAAELADFLEVCSPGELGICISQRLPAEKIIVAGVCKEQEYLMAALEYGVKRYVIESEHQMQLLASCMQHFPGQRVCAALRLTIGNQFGMFPEEAERLFQARSCDRVEINALHIYAGTQNRSADKHRSYLAMLSDLAQKMNQSGCGIIRKLIYGGGLPVSYFTGKHGFDDTHALDELAQIGRETANGFELEFELGRYLTASSGCYITRVSERRERDRIYIITDGGTHQLTYYNQQYGRRIPDLVQIPERPRKEQCVVCGVLCTGADIMLHDALLSELRKGDYLVFQNTGAYALTDGSQLFLSRELPPVYLKDRTGSISLIRTAVDTGLWNGGTKHG